MSAKVKIVRALVKFAAGKKFPSKYAGKPDRINVVFLTDGGDDITVWGDEDDELLRCLPKGQAVQLLCDDKNQYSVVETDELEEILANRQKAVVPSSVPNGVPDGFPAPPPPRAAKQLQVEDFRFWSQEERAAIAQVVTQNADLLAFCLKTSQDKFLKAGLVQEEESMRTLAVTLFIETVRQIRDRGAT